MKFEHLCDFSILIEPKAKGRPRFSKRGFAYTPKDTRDYEAIISNSLKKAFDLTPVEGRPLILELEFHMKRPKSSNRFYPIVKPDIDNLLKAVMDAANGVLYRDDNLICDLIVKKRYSAESYIRLKLSFLDCVVESQELAV